MKAGSTDFARTRDWLVRVSSVLPLGVTPLGRELLLAYPESGLTVRDLPPDVAGRDGVAPLAEAEPRPFRPPLPPEAALPSSKG